MAKKTANLSNITMYKNIVDNHYTHYLDLETTYNTLFTKPSCESSGYELYEIEKAMSEDAMVIFVFSQMTIEAFCNSYLLQYYSKSRLNKKSFIEKVNMMIVSMFKNENIKISKKEVSNYYGADIRRIIAIRKKQIHRYPVKISLNLSSSEKFEHDSKIAAKQIEEQYLRRFKKADIENAATAYQKLIDKLKAEGADFSALNFIY